MDFIVVSKVILRNGYKRAPRHLSGFSNCGLEWKVKGINYQPFYLLVYYFFFKIFAPPVNIKMVGDVMRMSISVAEIEYWLTVLALPAKAISHRNHAPPAKFDLRRRRNYLR